MMLGLLALIIAYLLGGVPFGYLLVRMTTGKDVRSEGSGNIGATNVLRTTGRGAGVATLFLDIAKGFAAVWIADKLTDGSEFWMSARSHIGISFTVYSIATPFGLLARSCTNDLARMLVSSF